MEPLTHRHRRFYFICFGILFFLSIPLVTAYALGYRFDDSYRLVSTGGIALTNVENDSQVYVNYSEKESSAFTQKTFYVQNLVPKDYFVVVARDGYWSWAKHLSVNSKMVTEASVLMVPKRPHVIPVSEYISRDDSMGFFSKNSTTSQELNSVYQTVQGLFSEKRVSSRQMPIVKGRVAVWNEKGVLFTRRSGQNETEASIFYIWPKPVRQLDFFPGRRDAVLLLADDGLYALEMDQRLEQNYQPVYLGKDLDFRISDDDVLYLKQGELYFEVVLE